MGAWLNTQSPSKRSALVKFAAGHQKAERLNAKNEDDVMNKTIMMQREQQQHKAENKHFKKVSDLIASIKQSPPPLTSSDLKIKIEKLKKDDSKLLLLKEVVDFLKKMRFKKERWSTCVYNKLWTY